MVGEMTVIFSHEQLLCILSTMPDPAFIMTRSGRYAAQFGGTDKRYYHDGRGLVGKTLFEVLPQEKAGWFAEQIAIALDSKALHIIEYSLSGTDIKTLESEGPDHPIWFEGRLQALGFQVENEDAVIWVASNITEKNAIQRHLRQQSETDSLTGLFNRRKLMTELQARYDAFRSQRDPIAILMFDVDNFKQINDEFGHQAGDAVLAAIGKVCRAELCRNDFIARLGGDEFVILMPETDHQAAEAIANLLRLRIAADSSSGSGTDFHATISGGVSEFLSSDTSAEDVLKRADDGLYLSKRNGRNRISIILAHSPVAKRA